MFLFQLIDGRETRLHAQLVGGASEHSATHGVDEVVCYLWGSRVVGRYSDTMSVELLLAATNLAANEYVHMPY